MADNIGADECTIFYKSDVLNLLNEIDDDVILTADGDEDDTEASYPDETETANDVGKSSMPSLTSYSMKTRKRPETRKKLWAQPPPGGFRGVTGILISYHEGETENDIRIYPGIQPGPEPGPAADRDAAVRRPGRVRVRRYEVRQELRPARLQKAYAKAQAGRHTCYQKY